MAKLDQWLERFEALSLRERLLLLLAGSSLLLLLVHQFWLAPQLKARQAWREGLAQIQQQSTRFSAQITELETQLQVDLNRENRQRLSRIEQASSALDQRLREQQQTLISPDRMPQVLEDVLQDLPLELLSLRKLPPAVAIDSEIEGVPRVYRHGLRLELQGSYRDTLDYLDRLERLPWRFAWEALDIRMEHYPRASVILHLYTLSFDEVWLGV